VTGAAAPTCPSWDWGAYGPCPDGKRRQPCCQVAVTNVFSQRHRSIMTLPRSVVRRCSPAPRPAVRRRRPRPPTRIAPFGDGQGGGQALALGVVQACSPSWCGSSIRWVAKRRVQASMVRRRPGSWIGRIPGAGRAPGKLGERSGWWPRLDRTTRPMAWRSPELA
jgi:hypothetical protein